MLIELKQIIVSPGRQLLLKEISWQKYKNIQSELGVHRNTRTSYYRGVLEIMAPLPEHEVGKVIIGDLIKALLEELNIDFWSLGSTTFDKESMEAGVEPDDCFYIDNEAQARGLTRINLETDPPPDLAIEIDITSRTKLNNYEALKVPELSRWNGINLDINILVEGKYIKSDKSRIFPNIPVIDVIPKYLSMSKTVSRNAAIKAFRTWVRQFGNG